jgi:hypothetical protein
MDEGRLVVKPVVVFIVKKAIELMYIAPGRAKKSGDDQCFDGAVTGKATID